MLTRKRTMTIVLASMVFGVLASVACATTTENMTPYGQIYAGGIEGQRHSLNSVYGTSLNGSVLACVTAFNNADGSQAGTADCEPYGTLAYHAYNGTTLRNAFIYPQPNVTISGSGYQTY